MYTRPQVRVDSDQRLVRVGISQFTFENKEVYSKVNSSLTLTQGLVANHATVNGLLTLYNLQTLMISPANGERPKAQEPYFTNYLCINFLCSLTDSST